MSTRIEFCMIGGTVFVASVNESVEQAERTVNTQMLGEGFIRYSQFEHGALLLRVSQIRAVYIYDSNVTDGV